MPQAGAEKDNHMAFDDAKVAILNPKLSADQPIDDIVRDLLQTVHRKGRGFVLGLDRGDDGGTSIEVKEVLRPHDEWEAPAPYRSHSIEDTPSFVAYANRYGDSGKSLVFFDDTGATLTIDEGVSRGRRETISMHFRESTDWQEWSSQIGRPQNHRALLKFLMAHEHNLDDVEVLKSMQSMRLNSVVNVESDIKDDGQSVGIFIKTNAGEELKRFPKTFGIRLPVLDQDVTGEGDWCHAEMRLETQLPDDPKQGPAFTLHCSLWQQSKKARVDAEGEAIREGLPGWPVIHGRHSTTDRKLPSA